MASPQQNIRQATEDQQMAAGVFNPYVRDGYLSPALTTRTAVTHSVEPVTQLTSSLYDTVTDNSYFADNGPNIYKLTGSNSTTLNRIIQLETGNKIQDLEIYKIGEQRKLFYVYSLAEVTYTSSLNTSNSWVDAIAVIQPVTNTSPAPEVTEVLKDFQISGSSTLNFTVPTGQTRHLIVFTHNGGGQTVSSISLGGPSITLEKEYTFSTFTLPSNIRIYRSAQLSAGSYTLTTTMSSSATFGLYAVLVSGANTSTPVIESNISRGFLNTSYNTVSDAGTTSKRLILKALFAQPTIFGFTGASAGSTYNPGTQTGNVGNAMFVRNDNAKLYVTNNTNVYSYTVATPGTISSATYDTQTFNFSTWNTNAPTLLHFSPDGTKMYILDTRRNEAGLRSYTLSTPWNVTTATVDSTWTAPFTYTNIWGFTISSDGTNIIFSATRNTLHLGKRNRLIRCRMTTPFNLSTMVLEQDVEIAFPYTGWGANNPLEFMKLACSDTLLYYKEVGNNRWRIFRFNSRIPMDIANLQDSGQEIQIANSTVDASIPDGGTFLYFRNNSNDDVHVWNLVETTVSGVSSRSFVWDNFYSINLAAMLTQELSGFGLEVGATTPGFYDINERNWLTKKQNFSQAVTSTYNFIRTADNGFGYLFAQNRVHKIDGTVTGGINGFLTKDVLLLPPEFTITDAIDYRSRFYIAIQQYPTNSAVTNPVNFTGKVGVLVWNRISTQLGGTDFIEIPGVKEIKKLYVSADGRLRMITIGDHGITEIREFTYNDSGGVSFLPTKLLSIGAFPQFPDGLVNSGDKVIWMGNDGRIYCEKGRSVTAIHELKAPGNSTATVLNNIQSGTVLFASGNQTANNGLRSNKQGYYVSWKDGATTTTAKIFPFDDRTGAQVLQVQHPGHVYTGVFYLPQMSTVESMRIYNLPLVDEGPLPDTPVAKIEIFYNQSTTSSHPHGTTKTITAREAAKGYLDLKLNKQYIHAVQMKITWEPINQTVANTYRPSMAYLTYKQTAGSTPDNE